MDAAKRKRQAKWIRQFRKIHRFTGIFLFAFFLLIGITGLLLGWKKQIGFLPGTAKGISSNAADWLPLESLKTKATAYLIDSVDGNLSTKLDRIDVRPDKGIAKMIYADHYFELQLDCTTGYIIKTGERNSDFIEHLHDFSIFDREIKTGTDIIKLIYTSIMGLAVITFSITGFWLWYGPKRMKHYR
ncbi:MAG: PepSY domain-containing protein [Chitinophagaceae bacterium]